MDDGDVVIRELPNKKLRYEVVECEYSPGSGRSIPPHYKLKLHREGRERKKVSSTNNFNFTGPAAVQVGDGDTQNVGDLISQFNERIDNVDASEEDKNEAKSRVRAFFSHPIVAGLISAGTGVAIS